MFRIIWKLIGFTSIYSPELWEVKLFKEIIPLSNFNYSFLCGLFEMTGGIKNIAALNIPINIKATIITFFISFGGFSIHMQVMSFLSNTNIKYIPYLIARILHGIIASSIIYIILYFN